MADRAKMEDEIADDREMDASDGYVAPPRYGPNPFATVDEKTDLESRLIHGIRPEKSTSA